ncbi:ATP-dependent DNA helicase recQ [Xylariaceae sp. FL1272]|nr:ATP-dependent DNA helicase recQ [Xylariaceae sp. FL1272]
MSEYDSGDDLLDDIDADDLVVSGGKRALSSPTYGSPNKRVKLDDDAVGKGKKVETTAKALLKKSFGYDDFRHEQASAIKSTLMGDNVLVVFPTGAGKSLCYQIPGIAFEKLDEAGLTNRDPETAGRGSGLTVVVSPLIALMKDQVDALQRRNISAACLDSTKTFDEQRDINADMREGRLRILYCAPERLNNENFVQSIMYLPGGIRLVAVDEAHCISEWGHSFRPDYLKVARFVQETKAERVVCLTATATPLVVQDICKAFDIKESRVFRTPPYRPNLELNVEALVDVDEKFPKLLQFLSDHQGPSLVYVTLQREAEELAKELRIHKLSAAAFHAGLPAPTKSKIQDEFMASKIRIVVATIAFGMGIDKSDIRNIVHYNIPSTVEEYSQQIGRAGRDGKPSTCMVYMCNGDFWMRENFARGDLPSRQSLEKLFEDIFFRQQRVKLPDGSEVIKLSLFTLGKEYDIRSNPLSIILATVELRYGLIRAITPEYSSYKFEAMPGYYTVAKADKAAEARAIVFHAKKAQKWYSIDVSSTANVSKLFRNDIIRKLNEFNDRGLIKLKASGVENRYKILRKLPATAEEVRVITDQLHAELSKKEGDEMKRFEAMIGLFLGRQCFAQALASYFGTQLPSGSSKCGHCSFCATGKQLVLPPKPKAAIDLNGIRKILAVCDVRDDPRFLARVAFGIKSPRVSQLGLDKQKIFGSLENHDFESLLKEFTKACEAAGYKA